MTCAITSGIVFGNRRANIRTTGTTAETGAIISGVLPASAFTF
jgi:hypothetical protein